MSTPTTPKPAWPRPRLAYAYRERFQKDVLIDLVGYRRWGHNEGDEPAFTQPLLYETIRQHPTVRALWAQRLDGGEVRRWPRPKRMMDGSAWLACRRSRRDLEADGRQADGRDCRTPATVATAVPAEACAP